MNQYNHYIMSMNTDSIASIFSPEGELGDIAQGRDSIKRFLYRFKDFKVLSQTSSTNTISIFGDSAIHNGTYWQTTIIPPSDTVHVKGSFYSKMDLGRGIGLENKAHGYTASEINTGS
jgi:hypothetical protein